MSENRESTVGRGRLRRVAKWDIGSFVSGGQTITIWYSPIGWWHDDVISQRTERFLDKKYFRKG